MKKVCFAWSGLPDYAARCIRAVINTNMYQITVIATRPDVPIAGMERSLGQEVTWVDGSDQTLDFARLGLPEPDVFFSGGYNIPAFWSLITACNRRSIPVVLLSDNNLHGGKLRQLAIAVRSRLFLLRRFDGILVPGEAGRAYAKLAGYAPSAIRTGLYSADPALFCDGRPLSERPKRFLFVGRFIDRKNVLGLTEAFAQFARHYPDWELHLCGSGPERHAIPHHDRLVMHDFVQPPDLAAMMREMRCLVLPSLREHFGLVVHEAALSGCALALSDTIGAAADLAADENAVVFPAGDADAIEAALSKLAGWSDEDWNKAGKVSASLAARIGPAQFANSVAAFVQELAA